MEPELKRKIIPIKVAVKMAYNQMPNVFSALNLCQTVRRILSKPTMDGSILRRLRELREAGKTPYKVKDSVNAIYQKL